MVTYVVEVRHAGNPLLLRFGPDPEDGGLAILPGPAATLSVGLLGLARRRLSKTGLEASTEKGAGLRVLALRYKSLDVDVAPCLLQEVPLVRTEIRVLTHSIFAAHGGCEDECWGAS